MMKMTIHGLIMVAALHQLALPVVETALQPQKETRRDRMNLADSAKLLGGSVML